MKHRWAILCESTSVDRQTNNASLFNIIDEVQFGLNSPLPENKPTLVPFQAVLAVLTERSNMGEPETGIVKSTIHAPDGTRLGEMSITIDLSEHLRTRAVSKLQNFAITGEGIYEIRIFHVSTEGAWDQVDTVPLQVKLEVIVTEPTDVAH